MHFRRKCFPRLRTSKEVQATNVNFLIRNWNDEPSRIRTYIKNLEGLRPNPLDDGLFVENGLCALPMDFRRKCTKSIFLFFEVPWVDSMQSAIPCPACQATNI